MTSDDRDRLRALEDRVSTINRLVVSIRSERKRPNQVEQYVIAILAQIRRIEDDLAALLTVEAPRPQKVDVHELARDIDFAIDVTEPRAVLLARFEDVIRQHLNKVGAVEAPRDEGWQPIETAPTGSWPGGPNDVLDPDYVKPPHVWLLLEDGQRCVGYFDAYYAEGGNAYDGEPPWVEEFSGERVRPGKWRPLPPAPERTPQ